MNAQLFAAYSLMTGLMIATPGPIALLVFTTGAANGLQAAFTAVAGTTLGYALLLAAIGFGLDWVMTNAAMLFEILRWIGAAYLIWLGIRAWRPVEKGGQSQVVTGHVHFLRGMLVAMSNPQTIIFYTVFLPQFVDPRLPSAEQLVAMCGAAVLMSFLTETFWAVASSCGHAWFVTPARSRILVRGSGAVLLCSGIWLLLGVRHVDRGVDRLVHAHNPAQRVAN